MRQTLALVIIVSLATGCATGSKSFYANPSKPDTTSLCRAYFETKDSNYQFDLIDELERRGLDHEKCRKRVNLQNAVVITAAAVAVGAAAVAVSRSGGGYASPAYHGAAWDGFRNQYGAWIWRCRDRATGQFVYNYRCNGIPVNDNTWPTN